MNSYDKDTWNVKSDPFAKMNKTKNVFGEKEKNQSVFDMPEKEKRSFSELKKDAQSFLSDEDKSALSTLAKSFSDKASEFTGKNSNKSYTNQSSDNTLAGKKVAGIALAIIFIVISIVGSITESLVDDFFDGNGSDNDKSYYTEYELEDLLNQLIDDPETIKDAYEYELVKLDGYVAEVNKDNNEIVLVPDKHWNKDCSATCRIYDYTPISGSDDEYASTANISPGDKIEFYGFISEINDNEYIIDVNEVCDIR